MLTDLVSTLGLGGSVVSAVSLGMIAWYMWRAKAIGRAAAGAASAAIAYALAVLTVGALVLALGWADPHPSIAVEHVRTAVGVVADTLAEPVRTLAEYVRDLVGAIG